MSIPSTSRSSTIDKQPQHAHISQHAWTAALAAVSPAGSAPHVWLDVGASWRSLTTWDLEWNASLVVVGVDALRSNLDDYRQTNNPRFLKVDGACSSSAAPTVTFYKHASWTCGSLLPTRADGPKLGRGRQACTGDVPKEITVRQFSLRKLLGRMRALGAGRIELLKIDVQGSEFDCLSSGGDELLSVDNILLEVQDVSNTSSLLMYDGAKGLAELDPLLASRGFSRQYCEWNRWARNVREMNCLYSNTRVGDGVATWMWATGNSKRNSSMVSYARERPKGFFDLVNALRTSGDAGARVAKS